MARSTLNHRFGLPELTASVRATRALPERRKREKMHAGSGFIWRIPRLKSIRTDHAVGGDYAESTWEI
jgi:hypothetical protein